MAPASDRTPRHEAARPAARRPTYMHMYYEYMHMYMHNMYM